MDNKKNAIKHLIIRLKGQEEEDFKTERLWKDKPASIWLEALPIWNGHLRGMIYGGTKSDETQSKNPNFFP